jgi:tetratricopeptide (TPR) repeat protein/serine/threonine protein kinase
VTVPEHQPQVDEVFDEALRRAAGADRAHYLDEACGGDPELRRRVERLLKAVAEAGSFLEAPAQDPSPTVDQPPVERPGTTIGPYKLIEQIGEGGMGTVWMAQQTEPVKRLVAVKLIKAGMDSKQVIARFEAERQALALMEHPNIARVLDGGTSESGRPYFVMDLVKGVPITRYCDEHHLTPRQRLELFLPVCQAVQHAHQKGIIHRDLKPSNVLVAQYDGKPVPKVIDFGVAKAAGQQLTDKTLVTGFGNIVGTLEYMSPEQAEINQLDVDTRSDIYSLGVLLYELLTGSPPFTKKDLEKAGMLEMLRVIREQEPSKPSTKLSTAEGLPTLAANRGTEPARLTKLVRGELDWIVMKALEKDRNRRYETANGFAMDVQRYLADEPVQACPPSAGYRLRKFVRRNKPGLMIAGLVFFCLVLVGGGVGWLVADRAARHREAESKILEALETAEPLVREGNPSNLALLSAAQRVEAQLASGAVGPEMRSRAEQLLRDVHMLADLDGIRLRQAETKDGAMWNLAGAESEYAAAFATYGVDVLAVEPAEAAAQIRHSAIHEALLDGLDGWIVANWLHMHGAVGPALKHLREVADAADDSAWRREFREAALLQDMPKLKTLAKQPEALAQPPAVLVWLGGWNLRTRGLTNEAQALLRQAQQRHPADFWVNYTLANALILCEPEQQRPEEAVGYCRAAVAIRPSSAEAHNLLGYALIHKGDTDQAIAAYQQALALAPKFANARWGLAGALLHKGDLKEAIACYQKAIELDPKKAEIHYKFGGTFQGQKKVDEAIACYQKAIELDPNYADAHTNLGVALADKGQLDEAIAEYREAIRLKKDDALAHNNLGTALKAKGQLDEAIAEYREAIRLKKDYAEAHNNLGTALKAKGRLDEAIAEFREAIRINKNDAGLHYSLGLVLKDKCRLDEAIAEFREAIRINKNDAGLHSSLGWVLKDKGRLDEAIACFRNAIELDPESAGAHFNLGNGLRHQGKLDEAIACYRKASELDPKSAMVHYHLGSCLIHQGKLDEAIGCCRKAIEIAPIDPWAHYILGNALHAKDQPDEAIAAYREAIRLKKDNVWAHIKLANTLRAKGRLDEAIAEYRAAIAACKKASALAPNSAGLHNDLAWLLATAPDAKVRNPAEAVELARKAVELAPKDGNCWNTLGVAHYRAGKWKQALAALEKSMQLQGENAFDRFFLAMTHWQLASKNEARRCYDTGVEWMEKHAKDNEELRRFRSEAEELLEIKKR